MPEKKLPIQIEQDPNAPVQKKILAKELVALSRAAISLLNSGLGRKDLIALLHRRAPSVGKPDIGWVLEAIEELGKNYAVQS